MRVPLSLAARILSTGLAGWDFAGRRTLNRIIHEHRKFYRRLMGTSGGAARFMRQDATRFVRPDAVRYLRPDWERYFPPSRREGKQDSEAPPSQDSGLVDQRSEADRLRFLAEVASLRFELAVLRLSTRANKALHHSNFQPRVPAGSADGGQFADGGGQWIQIAQRGGDKLPGISGPGGDRRGHHCMPQWVFKKYALSDEALAVFDKARSGLLET